ncbi:MAG: glycosyltransferase family 10 domain-containing protein [Hyphomicrobiaceae bacterium]
MSQRSMCAGDNWPTDEDLFGHRYGSVPNDLRSNRLLVLAWTEHYFGDDYLAPKRVPNPNGPDIELTFTTDRDRLGDADAVWFHAPSVNDVPRRKEQPWILMSMESDVNYPALKNPAVLAQFDHLMTYRLDSDIPCVYPNWHQYGTFLNPPPTRSGPSRGALATFIASNSVLHRDSYVSEMLKYVSIDCLGECLHNADIEALGPAGWARGAWKGKLSVLPHYKFYLAFENSIATDYVTERIFHAFQSGVVPVYRGAPNIQDFVPEQDAVIDAADFASPKELAQYLRALDNDDEAYARHLAWKHDGYSQNFEALVNLGSVEPQWRMAVKLAHGCDHSCRCGGRLRQVGVLP